MTDEIYNDTTLERIAADEFRKNLQIKQVIVRDVPTGRTSNATLFLTSKNRMYLFVRAEAPMILDDVRKITHRMGLEAGEFIAPFGDREYFSEVAKARFKAVFPGRAVVNEDDIRFYKMLAPYNPALVLITAIKLGEIRQFDPDSGQWRVIARYSYRHVT
ncbi:hypothetical protein CYG49_04585, partial [Candidatus Saccharibacteria bacterium]